MRGSGSVRGAATGAGGMVCLERRGRAGGGKRCGCCLGGRRGPRLRGGICTGARVSIEHAYVGDRAGERNAQDDVVAMESISVNVN